jgi:hypothetical protein
VNPDDLIHAAPAIAKGAAAIGAVIPFTAIAGCLDLLWG